MATTMKRDRADAKDSEVTPAMLDAGVDAYLACDREFEAAQKIVMDVFQAMEQARARGLKPVVCSVHRTAPISPWWQT
jgi:hypothetical protein